MKAVNLGPDELKLIGILKQGSGNPVSRSSLADLMGTSDRQVRKMIERAGAAGVIICNEQNGRGYYIAEDIDEIERQYRQELSRMKSMYKRTLPLRRALKEAGRPVR